MNNKQLAHALVDRIPANQITAAVRFLEFLLLDPVARSVALALPDDEEVTAEDQHRLQLGQRQFGKGSSVPMEDVLADFGLKPEDFPIRR